MIKLSIKLQSEGKIKEPGDPFKVSDKKEIDVLVKRGIIVFEKYNEKVHSNTRLFKSQLV